MKKIIMNNDVKEKIVSEGKFIEREVRHSVFVYITAAFGLVAGLAWNDAVKSLIDYLFPPNQSSVTAKFAYATILTIVLAFITIYLVKILKEKERS